MACIGVGLFDLFSIFDVHLSCGLQNSNFSSQSITLANINRSELVSSSRSKMTKRYPEPRRSSINEDLAVIIINPILSRIKTSKILRDKSATLNAQTEKCNSTTNIENSPVTLSRILKTHHQYRTPHSPSQPPYSHPHPQTLLSLSSTPQPQPELNQQAPVSLSQYRQH